MGLDYDKCLALYYTQDALNKKSISAIDISISALEKTINELNKLKYSLSSEKTLKSIWEIKGKEGDEKVTFKGFREEMCHSRGIPRDLKY